MNLIAIDPSISSTSITIYNTELKKYYIYCYTTKLQSKYKDICFRSDSVDLTIIRQENDACDDFMRYMDISYNIMDLISEHVTDCKIYIERASYGSVGKLFSIGEFTALLKIGFYTRGFEVNETSPGEWKKSVIGNGAAKKEQIVEFCKKTSPIKKAIEYVENISSHKKEYIFDVCDSFCICLSKQG